MIKFEQALDRNPEDWTLRLVYADYLEEIGDNVLSNAQHWMAKNKRCPVLTQFKKWVWESSKNKPHGAYTLPNYIFDLLEYHLPIDGWSKKFYDSREDAEEALANALVHVVNPPLEPEVS